MKKGISPEKVAYLIFALIGVVIILAIYLNYYGKSQGGIFCTVYGGIYSLLPSGDEPPPLPRACIPDSLDVPDATQIFSEDKFEVEDSLVEHIVSCYLNNKERGNITMPCYQLRISGLSGEISETDITDNMAGTKFICKTLENSKVVDAKGNATDYYSGGNKSCGSKDQIIWVVHGNVVKKGDIVEIKYVNRTVKVIA